MKRLYLILSIIGFLAPTFLVIMESIETGNILLYTQPLATIEGMFANRIASIFMIDLLVTVMVFFVWSYREAKTYQIKYLGVCWVLTMLLGLGGGFPLFLYLKTKAIESK